MIRVSLFLAYIVVTLQTLTGCSKAHVLVPTPNLYAQSGGYPAADIDPANRTSTAELLYFTDRAPETAKDGSQAYSVDRSTSLAFGTVGISFGDDLSWDELAEASGTKKRDHKIKLEIEEIQEIARFPETPLPFRMTETGIEVMPESMASQNAATEEVKAVLRSRLAATDDKEVTLFIHGFKNEFHHAALAMTDVWHFTGRKGVPIIYTWPAGNDGMFGYFRDRESGEFSVFHLKETLRLLTSMPEIERIHIIAHSRGTDIMATALRELIIETRAAGHNPRESLRIENLILAAPDLDFGVVRQRLAAEKFGPAMGRITVYINRGDQALGISQLLMSGLRFGKLGPDDMTESDKQFFSRVKNVAFVNVDGVSGLLGHSYYRMHPGVLSDIAIAIRERLMPGDSGRPLIHEGINFWRLKKDYPDIEAGEAE